MFLSELFSPHKKKLTRRESFAQRAQNQGQKKASKRHT